MAKQMFSNGVCVFRATLWEKISKYLNSLELLEKNNFSHVVYLNEVHLAYGKLAKL